jgi:hypothetical protein
MPTSFPLCLSPRLWLIHHDRNSLIRVEETSILPPAGCWFRLRNLIRLSPK